MTRDDQELDRVVAEFVQARGARAREQKESDPQLARVERAWTMSGMLADDPAIIALREQALTGAGRRRWFPSRASMAGGALVLSACLALIVLFAPPSVTSTPRTAEWETARGETRTVALDDGTRIKLDAQTRVLATISETGRRVELKHGRAYFEVQHDSKRPFVVEAANGRTVDLGTKFTVDQRSKTITVDVIEGSVAMQRGTAEPVVTLRAGEAGSYGLDQKAARIDRRFEADPLGWTRGTLILDEMPLGDAVELLSRYTARPILIGHDKQLSQRTVTGVFRTDHGDTIAQTLASALSLNARRQPDGAVMLTPN